MRNARSQKAVGKTRHVSDDMVPARKGKAPSGGEGVSDLFEIDRDRRFLELWFSGKHLVEIAAAMGVTWSRAAHDINRLLNERNGFFARQRYD
jgi:hypothetical protein